MAPPTILAHKSVFLAAQTLQLSQNLAPSPTWHRTNESNSDNALSQRLVDDALYRLNHTLQQHTRRVYPPQGTRAVAEQIDALFLDVGNADNGDADDAHDHGMRNRDEELRLGMDFSTDAAIATLSPTWTSQNAVEASSNPPEANRYTDLHLTLSQLSARRAEAKARIDRLRHMQTLLDPFKNAVQENLVTRNGDMEKELERMRVLLVRVAARVAQLPDAKQHRAHPHPHLDVIVPDYEEVERKKVEMLLDGL